ncbi:uncharacterized protein LOC130704153 [Daphnia carinata]|uniref:uncharacterized protein LOC130704153 n=1 Tax=Daphnia carinata TaxID=120202 RepID=UPI002868D6A4|nr:uncharacterized protein LOC130704153 [Daphnia carinata]
MYNSSQPSRSISSFNFDQGIFYSEVNNISITERMTNSLVFLFVGFATLTSIVNAQNPTCPTGGPAAYCSCYAESPGFRIECDGGYADPEEVRQYLIFHQSYGLIVSLTVKNIMQSTFNYVPDDFLVGNQVPSVSFKCGHGFSVNQGILVFSVRAFTDSFNECGLTGDLTFSNCNLRQFDAAVLNNCNRLNKLAFMDSHVESLIDIPTLRSLTNFTVYSPRQWAGANQRGLSRMSLAPGASLPLLTYLDLTGNSLDDGSISFVAEETIIEEMHLEGNNFAFVPNLTSAFNLHTFSIALNVSSSTPILLPNPRSQSRSLNASFYSNFKIKNEVALLDGMFGQDAINLKLNMTEFREDVFFEQLSQSSGLIINLNSAARILCSCYISWLLRDNRSLLNQVKNGFCTDGRSFESIPLEDFACCGSGSLMKRIERQQKEIENLKATVNQLLHSEARHDF